MGIVHTDMKNETTKLNSHQEWKGQIFVFIHYKSYNWKYVVKVIKLP